MAAQKGRECLVKANTTGATFTTIGGARTKSMTINSEQVDVSNSDSPNQWRQLLEGAGIKSMSMALAGVFEDDAAFASAVGWALAGTIVDWQFIYPGLGTFEGKFQIASADLNGEYNAEAQYSYSLESAGEITFVAS